MDQVKFFNGYLPQILLSPVMNNLTQMLEFSIFFLLFIAKSQLEIKIN